MDLCKQGAFEAGVLLFFIATHEDFIPDYPTGCGDPGRIAYDVMTAVDWSCVPASYPAGLRDLLAGLLTCDARTRWSIRAAMNSLRELVIAEGMVCTLQLVFVLMSLYRYAGLRVCARARACVCVHVRVRVCACLRVWYCCRYRYYFLALLLVLTLYTAD
jgi:hypothetical protein